MGSQLASEGTTEESATDHTDFVSGHEVSKDWMRDVLCYTASVIGRQFDVGNAVFIYAGERTIFGSKPAKRPSSAPPVPKIL
jgi:hypothetical protein